MIHVLYGMTDRSGRFSKYPATSIVSIFENTRDKVTIHLLHDSTLSKSNREKFLELVAMYHQRIEFYNVDEIFSERMRILKQKYDSIPKVGDWAFGAMYRLLAPELIDLPKIIYFDTDILVNLDLSETWAIDLGNYPIAAKPEANVFPNIETVPPEIDAFALYPKKICDELHLVKRENYFSSAVSIYNLDLIRKIFAEESTTLIDTAFAILEKFPLEYPDQDALNFLFSESCLHLPDKYNVFVWQRTNYLRGKNLPLKLDPWVYHYSGYNQRFEPDHPFCRLWFEYFCKTPFCDADTFFNLAKDYKDQLDAERIKIQKSIALASRKHLAAFVFENDLPKIEQFRFEKTILVQRDLQLNAQNLLDFLKEDQEKNFVMLFIGGYQKIAEILTHLGFIENESFCDGRPYLAIKDGGSFKNDQWIVFDM